jgi:phosphoribosylglycinamide formyltransferase-1
MEERGATMKRVAVLVSGGGTNLQALLDAQVSGAVRSAQVTLVVSSAPGAYALKRAEQAGLAHVTIPRAQMPLEAFEEQLQRLLKDYAIDLIVLAGFLTILSENFTRLWPRKILNVHPSLIPAFCGKDHYGLRVHQAALDYGVKITGATVHFVNEVCDGGEILLQKAVEILPGDTAQTLQRRVMEQAEWVLLPQAVELAAQGALPPP